MNKKIILFYTKNLVTEQNLKSIDLELMKFGMDINSLKLRNQNDHNLDIQNSHETILGKTNFA